MQELVPTQSSPGGRATGADQHSSCWTEEPRLSPPRWSSFQTWTRTSCTCWTPTTRTTCSCAWRTPLPQGRAWPASTWVCALTAGSSLW